MRGLQIKSRTNRQTGVWISRLLHRCARPKGRFGENAMEGDRLNMGTLPQAGGALVGGGSDKVNREDRQHEGQWRRQPDSAAGGWRLLGGRGRGVSWGL